MDIKMEIIRRKLNTKRFKMGPIIITIHWGDKRSAWGRFGGGWNWKMGFQIGGTSCILNLLVLSIRLSIYEWSMRRKSNENKIG